NEIFAKSFRDVRMHFIHVNFTRAEIFCKQRTIYVNGPDLNVGIFFLEELRGSGYSATSTCSYNKMCDLSVCLSPDFGTSTFIMRESVCEVVVLVHEKCVGN